MFLLQINTVKWLSILQMCTIPIRIYEQAKTKVIHHMISNNNSHLFRCTEFIYQKNKTIAILDIGWMFLNFVKSPLLTKKQ